MPHSLGFFNKALRLNMLHFEFHFHLQNLDIATLVLPLVIDALAKRLARSRGNR